MKAEMLLFSILMSGGHLGGHLDVYSTLKLRVNSVKNRKNAKFQSKIDVQVSTLVSTRHQNYKKQHLSFHWKKIIFVSFFVTFLAQSEFKAWVFGSTVDPPFFMKMANLIILWKLFLFCCKNRPNVLKLRSKCIKT